MFRRIGEHRRQIAHWAMELVIVVVGVLIALGAQQWAENEASKRRAEAADVRIRDELGSNIYLGIERIAVHRCLKQRLATLADGLSTGRTDWRDVSMADGDDGRMAFRRIYRMPSRPWVSDEYQGSLASGALDSVELERKALFASVYTQIGKQRDFNIEENRLGTQLAVLQFGQPLGAGERNALLATVARLDYLNATMVLISRQNIKMFRDLGYRSTVDEARSRLDKGWPAAVAGMRERYGDCVDAKAVTEFEPATLG